MRLLLTVANALLSPRCGVGATVVSHFRVLPSDVGLATFKSDRYFTAADAAQFDFAIRIGLLRPFLREGVRWVNLAQAGLFRRPLRLGQPFRVSTRVVCVDTRHMYIAHVFESAGEVHAELLVKLKFKKGRLTVPPQDLFPDAPVQRNASVEALDALHQTQSSH